MKHDKDPFGYQKKLKNAVKELNRLIALGNEIPFKIMKNVTHKIVKAEYTDEWGGEAYIETISDTGKKSRWNVGSTIFNLI
jgi:hypothetical protein